MMLLLSTVEGHGYSQHANPRTSLSPASSCDLLIKLNKLLLVQLTGHLHYQLSDLVCLWYRGRRAQHQLFVWPASAIWESMYSGGSLKHIDSKCKQLQSWGKNHLSRVGNWKCHVKNLFGHPFVLRENCLCLRPNVLNVIAASIFDFFKIWGEQNVCTKCLSSKWVGLKGICVLSHRL